MLSCVCLHVSVRYHANEWTTSRERVYASREGSDETVLTHRLIRAFSPGLSHPFLGMGPGPTELGKLAAF